MVLIANYPGSSRFLAVWYDPRDPEDVAAEKVWERQQLDQGNHPVHKLNDKDAAREKWQSGKLIYAEQPHWRDLLWVRREGPVENPFIWR